MIDNTILIIFFYLVWYPLDKIMASILSFMLSIVQSITSVGSLEGPQNAVTKLFKCLRCNVLTNCFILEVHP